MQIKYLLSVIFFTLCGAIFVSHACGLWLPQPYLTRNDDFFYEPPQVGFGAELEHVLPDSAPHLAVLDDELVERGREDDLLNALEGVNCDRDVVLQDYRSVRALIRSSDPLVKAVISEDFPVEFRLYLQGARAYHLEELETARGYWQRLLDLPEAQRRYRSTEAAYMLAWTGTGDAVVDNYQRVRELASNGFADSDGLAAASYGWEAQFYLRNGNYSGAIDLYLLQWGAGYHNALLSLKMTAGRAFSALGARAELEGLAVDPATRAVMTAYLLDSLCGKSSQNKRRLWLRALPRSKSFTLKEAGRFALLEYQLNNLDACRKWLKYASADDALALWISSKLMLRDGHILAGQTLMLALTKQMKDDAENPDWRRIDTADAWGELGLLMLSRERYIDAADAFANTGSWQDLAYILERLLTTDELLVWLERRGELSLEARSYLLGRGPHLLAARRLMREALFEQALELFDTELRQTAKVYLEAMRQANDLARTEKERAKYYWEAAKVMRESGLEIFGAELAPDYAWLGGSVAYTGDLEKARAEPRYAAIYCLNQTTGGELTRARETKVKPDLRFHYRYRAAQLAELAAGLLPNDDENAARIYCIAGSWLKLRDPDAADRLFKQLVVRCPNTELGKAAAKVNWFPQVELETIEPFADL